MDTTQEVKQFRLFYVFLTAGLVDMSSESLNFSNATKTEKQMHLYPKMASRLEQNLRLKALGYLLFIPANFFICCLASPWPTFGCYWANSITHPMFIWAISFWPWARMGGVGSIHLTECPVSFDHNAITPQIAENTLPRLKPSFSKMQKCPQYPKQV